MHIGFKNIRGVCTGEEEKEECCHRQHTYRLECLNLGAECARFHVFLGQVVPGVTGIPTLTNALEEVLGNARPAKQPRQV